MKTNPKITTATIHNLSHDGRGIAHIDGKVTFIRNALPGETVEFIYNKQRSKFDEGEAKTIITASSERQTPECGYFGYCGGCQMQMLSSSAQIQWKEKIVLEHIQHIGKTEPTQLLKPLQAQAYHYRHKARLGVRVVRNKPLPLVGFRETNGRFIADMQSCEILAPHLAQLIMPLRLLLSKMSAAKMIPQIEMAASTQPQAALIFRHLEPLNTEDKSLLIDFAKQYSVDIYLQPSNNESIYLFYPENKPAHLAYQFNDWPIEWLFHPLDFTQIHPTVNQQMLQQALQLLQLSKTETVLDLFCGLGNFTLPMALQSKKVTGIEGASCMVDRATQNAIHNMISNTEFFMADLEKPVEPLPWALQHYDKIVLDPPRSGAINLLPFLGGSGASHILYVSCQPSTLARDTFHLVHDHGYQLDALGVMDMFPQTQHVETMALFTKT